MLIPVKEYLGDLMSYIALLYIFAIFVLFEYITVNVVIESFMLYILFL